ncbi:transglutaminase domain-containing protein [Porphyromonas sp.]|uniref:transglutaminase domain-containing protein n=1 Tax=Porphyromonas sp. TaxID=1924944 RepID=UPI0026DCE6F6|nr:transglutaminase domain-containing protein [Porphyromonas sp.]MDO4771163.1 transglutaminase domain-containing protein [Porphyromonas sp.]
MKKAKLMLIACAVSGMLFACTNNQSQNGGDEPTPPIVDDQKAEFAQPDNSIAPKGESSERLVVFLKDYSLESLLPLGETYATEAQLKEMKKIADKAIADANAKTEKEKVLALIKWIRSNVKYSHGEAGHDTMEDYNSAYSTCTDKVAICQGFANALKALCYTQGISCPVVNGILGVDFGHAWNYAYADKRWIVADPTNEGGVYELTDNSYYYSLRPERIDFTLWKDDMYDYSLQIGQLSVINVKKSNGPKLKIPYSVNGFRITNFNPNRIPEEVKEVYLGSNISHIGMDGFRMLKTVGSHLERVYVAKDNPYLEEFGGAVYQKREGGGIIYVPNQLKILKLKPVKVIGKETVKDLYGIEEIHFSEGTEEIRAYAIENCPNLKRVVYPKSLKTISPDAYIKCPKFEIVQMK